MKYQLGESRKIDGRTMHRVVALVAIASKGVAAGDVGGWVESERNLSQVSDEAWVSDEAQVFGKARVSGEAWVFGKARVSGKIKVIRAQDLLLIGPIGSRGAWLTLGLDYAATGCFCGGWEKFAAQVRETHGDSEHAREYLAALEFAKIRFPEATK